MTPTRTIAECQDLAELWLGGEKDAVIEQLGGEPSERFIADYRPGGPYGLPVRESLKLVDTVKTAGKVKTKKGA